MLEGTGGVQALDDEAKADMAQTIDDEVLVGTPIEVRSTSVEGGRVEGSSSSRGTPSDRLQLAAREDGRFTGRAIVRQSDLGMKPYSALFGRSRLRRGRGSDETEPHSV